MEVRMTHPTHGAMHAHSTTEVEVAKAHGWSVEDAPAPLAADAILTTVDAVPAPQARVARKAKGK